MDIIGACQEVVDALASAGIAAGTDTDFLDAPCAWVAHDTLEIITLDGGADVNLSVFLAVPANGYAHEIAALQDLLTAALTVITPDGPVELNAGLQTSVGVLPAFRLPLTMKAK